MGRREVSYMKGVVRIRGWKKTKKEKKNREDDVP